MDDKLLLLNKVLSVLVILLAVFMFGMLFGIYGSSKNIEQLATDNIVKERTIQEQKERIKELQEFKQLKEIYNA